MCVCGEGFWHVYTFVYICIYVFIYHKETRILEVRTPCVVIFFRWKKDSAIAGVGLIFNIPGVHNYGIDHFQLPYLVDDPLHTLSLGVSQRFVGLCFREVLLSNCFRVVANTKEQKLERGIFQLRKRLRRHYRVKRVTQPQHKLSRIRHLSVSMLGPADTSELKAKGGQTNDVISLATSLMHEFSAVGGRTFFLLASAGRALERCQQILRAEPRKMSPQACRELMEQCITHNTCFGLAGGAYAPKHHSFVHLAAAGPFSGNPAKHATFSDENANGIVARQGKWAHPQNFAYAVFRKQIAAERLALLRFE